MDVVHGTSARIIVRERPAEVQVVLGFLYAILLLSLLPFMVGITGLYGEVQNPPPPGSRAAEAQPLYRFLAGAFGSTIVLSGVTVSGLRRVARWGWWLAVFCCALFLGLGGWLAFRAPVWANNLSASFTLLLLLWAVPGALLLVCRRRYFLAAAQRR